MLLSTKLSFFLCLLLVLSRIDSVFASSLPDTVKSIKQSIVGVGSYNKLGSPQSVLKGTGFVVGNGNLIVTNYHVISAIEAKDPDDIVIFIGEGPKSKVRYVSLWAKDIARDIAILEQKGPRLPALELSHAEVREGETIAFTGFPIGAILGLYPVTHTGIISSITPIVIPAANARALNASVLKRLRDPFMVYQLDATAYPGNSGSPVYMHTTGRVVGVVNKVFVKESKEAVLEKPSGITYAIPADVVTKLIENTYSTKQ